MKLKLKRIGVFILTLVLFITNPSFATTILAATSWTQSNWSGGAGQGSWSDATKFSSSTEVTTSTANQTTITGTEELTNTGFETDLTGWTQTAENYAGIFTDTNFLTDSSAVAAWPLDDTTTTQSYARVLNPAVATGRNILVDGDMEANNVTVWAVGNSATITKDTTSPHGGTRNLRVARNGVNAPYAYQGAFTAGKTYRITGYARSDGSATPRITDGAIVPWTGTTSTSWQAFDFTEVAPTTVFTFGTSTSTGTQYVEFDDVTITQINIPASNSTYTQLLTDGDMETSGTGAWTVINSATLTKETGTPHGGTQVLRVASTGTINSSARQSSILTIGNTYRIHGYARGDGTATPRVSSSTVLFTGTTSTAWQSFDVIFVAKTTSIDLGNGVASAGNYVEYDDVVVSEDTYIRTGELLQDNDMEQSGTSYWTSISGAVLSKQTTSPHGGSQVLRIARDGTNNNPTARQLSVLVVGKTYRVTGYARSDGSAAPNVNDGTDRWTGSTLTSWQSFDLTFVAGGANLSTRGTTSTGTQYVEFDDISVTEVDPLVGKPLLGVTLGSASGGHLTNAYSFDGTNDNVNIYSTDLNSAFNPNEGTLVAWVKVSGSGVWSDSTNRGLLYLNTNANNQIFFGKSSTTNYLQFLYVAGGTTNAVYYLTSAPTTWIQLAITWSKSNDQVKAYSNGAQVGTTQTGLGTWVGNFVSTTAVIGAYTTSGSSPWSGLINDVRLYDTALSDTQILNLYNGFATTYETTTKYAGAGSVKTVAEGHSNVDVIQSVNVGDTENYFLSGYAYTDGSAVTSSDVELFYNGSTISTTYTSVGSGWYKLTGIVTGANEARNYGFQVKSGKTVYIDNASLKSSSGSLTSSIFDTGGDNSLGTEYGSLTFSATTPSNTTASVRVRTSNNSDMSGATVFSSCNLLSSGASILASSCVSNLQRYVQYQIILSNTDGASTPTFTAITLNFSPKATSSSPPGCSESAPSSAPTVTSVKPLDQNTLQVIWSRAGDPVSYYALEYGTVSGTYTWGVTSFGNSQSTSYTVGLLSPKTTYYFKVRAGNGCATGAWSNEASGTTGLIKITTPTSPTVPPSIVPPAPQVPTLPTPTPTTGPGPLPPEKPGGISLPSIDLQSISDFFRNNLNALSSFWNTVKTNTQQSLIALERYVESFGQKSLSFLASIFTRTEDGVNTIAGGVAYQTSNLLKTTNQTATRGTEMYMKNLETSVRTSAGNAFNLGFNISNIFNKANRGLSNFVGRSQSSVVGLGQFISRTITLIANNVGRSITTIARVIDNSSKMHAAIATRVNSDMVATTGNAASTIGGSVGNQIGMVSNSVTKTVTTSLGATNKQLGKLTNTINARFALISGATNKALTRVQTFIAMVGQYWFNSEPTKILVVDVTKTSPTTAVITWQTNQLASSAVNYGFDTSYGQRAQSDELVKDHKIELTGLEPNKTYFFEVMSQGKTYVYDSYYTFQTTDDLNQLFKKAKVEVVGNKGDWILVRNAPTKEGGVIAKVGVGEVFSLLMEKDGWMLIKLDGSEGWISGEFSKLIE